jgi:hypothetical protein
MTMKEINLPSGGDKKLLLNIIIYRFFQYCGSCNGDINRSMHEETHAFKKYNKPIY